MWGAGKEQNFSLCDLTLHVFVGFVNGIIVIPSLVIQDSNRNTINIDK
jgi:hypothetical protein